jgi:hypothetical protein
LDNLSNNLTQEPPTFSSDDLKPFSGLMFLIPVAFIILGALVAVFMAGDGAAWSYGAFLLISGVTLIGFRSRVQISWRYFILSALILLSAGLSLLPLRGPLLPWRAALLELQGLHLPNAVSLDPSSTVFWLVILGATIFVGLFLLATPMDSKNMGRIGFLALIGCTVYALLAWISLRTGWHYPFFHPTDGPPEIFGFFPNRNHTAGFLVTGAVLSLGLIQSGLRRGKIIGSLIAFLCFSTLVASLLVFSRSRAGLLFLLLGGLIWILGLGRHRSRLLVLGSLGIALFVLTLFLASESDLLERLKGESRTSYTTHGLSVSRVGDYKIKLFDDERVPIALDTISIVGAQPMTGVGLGTYAIVYPYYADRSIVGKTTALHPENDWLMMAAEGGVPFLLLVLIGLGVLFSKIPILHRSDPDGWPVRWAFIAAFLAELLHGLVDVPVHKVELGWWILVLGGVGFAGAGVQVQRGLGILIQRVLLGSAGLFILIAGIVVILGQVDKVRAIPPMESRDARMKLLNRYAYAKPEERGPLFKECERLLALYPMNGSLHYQYGIFLLQEHRTADAVAQFRVARSLSPWNADLAFEQGGVLAGSDPQESARIWKGALMTRLKIDHHPGEPIARTAEMFSNMIGVSASFPDLNKSMPDLSLASPETRMMWLTQPLCDPQLLALAARDAAFMSGLSSKDQGRLFELWWQRGDKKKVEEFLRAHPEYSRTAIATKAAIAASSGREEEACRSLMGAFQITLPPLPDPSSGIQAAESDVPAEPLSAAKYYLEHGNEIAARRLLSEASSDPANTKEILLLKSRMEWRAKDWKALLDHLLQYLHASGQL